MGFHGLAGAVYQITLWIARFAFLNILWVIFTLIGLIICGAFPATVAAYHVSRQWVQGKSISIFSEYLSEYKKCFIHANILGWSTAPPVFLTVLLALRLAVISQSQYSSIFVMIFSFLFLIISIYIIFLLPVYTHYNVKLGGCI
ncbi:YesL family protein [Gracilibacillus boraciitolerans]|uniref:YesL family protein n=1 Tax=Gracilibacillus boraciitolerans TaxID=307521 RepID=UPI00068BE863